MNVLAAALDSPSANATHLVQQGLAPEKGKEPRFERDRPSASIALYGEADLVQAPQPHRSAHSGLMRDLLGATSARKREAVIRERLDEMGFEWMGYYTIAPQPGGAPRRAFLTTYSDQDWVKRYFDEHYDDVDPRLVQQPRCSLPLAWDIAYLENCLDGAPSPRARRFIHEMQEIGMYSGVFLRVPSQVHAGEHAVISLESSAANRRWIGDRVLGDALAFALSLHDYMAQHVRIPAAALADDVQACGTSAGGLPTLQQAVLDHVVHGLTDREIARRLQVSEHTVDYHLRQLRQRFAVHNRVQLVSAAARATAAV